MKNLLPLLLLLLAVSCRQPQSTETFLRGTGPFEFAVDMGDSTLVYDFDLFSRIDATEFPSQLQLDIAWKNPVDSVFTETVWLPVSRGNSFFSQEAYAPYRADVVPAVFGPWTLSVAVPNPPEGFRGLGLVMRWKANPAQVAGNE